MSKNITWTAGAMSALTLVLTCKNIACATQSILVVTQMGRCAVLHCVALLHCVSLLGHKWAGVTRMNRARDVQHRALDHTRKHGHVVLTMYTRKHKTHTHTCTNKHVHEPKYVVCAWEGGLAWQSLTRVGRAGVSLVLTSTISSTRASTPTCSPRY